jgi:putative membrane protein
MALALKYRSPIMKFTAIAVLASVALMASGTVSAQQEKEKQSSATSASQKSDKGGRAADANRLKDLAQANMAEIEAGKLAAQKAQSAEVKKFAQRMVDDHSKQLEEIKKLAQTKGIELPTAPDAKHQGAIKKLQSASGEDFDKAYMRQQVTDHRDALKLAQRTAKGARDAELKSSAQKAAPEIQEHLKMAQQISASTKQAKKGQAGAGR